MTGVDMAREMIEKPPVATTDPSMLVVASVAESIKSARDFARGWLRAKGYADEMVAVAALVVTELVTNAYKHGSEPGDVISLRLYLSEDGPVVEVRDGSDAEPRVKPLTLDAFAGRGLAIVSELTAAWGFRRLSSGGKAVYAVLNGGAP
ncbi:ATP-binding protein [Actinomadura namibiensis]|uniref:Anti-sigma regulatory factor (Ser/Thr protein kinase) n=1 Tax=Actinomadura namibiensis TaxID=182080 RepID=A0A7W3LY37_ACTNM|nr:ATP-binding protein [Actinomadura namibiensis]MBA8956334.1 anti-sigma regulatory factor (Ser/Thr protein kinase) [Actinomadura namibiensis]